MQESTGISREFQQITSLLAGQSGWERKSGGDWTWTTQPGMGLPMHDSAMLWVHDKILSLAHLKLAAYFIMHEPTHCITGQHNLVQLYNYASTVGSILNLF